MIRAAVIAILALPALAHADPPGMTPPVVPSPSTYVPSGYSPYPAPPSGPVTEQPPGLRSYRGLTIGADFAAVGMFFYGISEDNEAVLKASIGTYVLASPIIHVAKGRVGSGLASLGMRLGFPLLGIYIGDALHTTPKCANDYYDDCYDEDINGEAVLGAILGIGTAMVVDSVYLARGDKPKAAPQPQWSPTLRASQGGFALGAAGTF